MKLLDEWKIIEDHEVNKNMYEINSDGLVRNRNTGKIIKPWYNRQRDHWYYSLVTYDKQKKKVNRQVHRLVAIAFIPNDEVLHELNVDFENKKERKRFRNIIIDIRNRKTYRPYSDKYDWWEKDSTTIEKYYCIYIPNSIE